MTRRMLLPFAVIVLVLVVAGVASSWLAHHVDGAMWAGACGIWVVLALLVAPKDTPYSDDGFLDITGFTRPGGDEDGPRAGSVIAAVVLIIFVALTAWLGWALLTLVRH